MSVIQPYISEAPVAHSLISSKIEHFCDNCFRTNDLQTCSSCSRMRYCDRKCQRAMWRLHKTECQHYRRVKHLPVAQIRLLIRILSITNQAQRQLLDNLMSHTTEFKKDMKFMSTFLTVLQTLSRFLDNQLPASEQEIFTMYCILQINSFMITDSSGADLAPAIYPNAARLDHSCIPDLEYVFSRKHITLIPVHASNATDQPRINYVDPLGTTAQRRTELRNRYFFECDCRLCADEARESEITALVCCGTQLPEETYPYSQVAQEFQSHLARSHRLDQYPAQTTIVRRCSACNTCYDTRLIYGVIDKLSQFRDAPPTMENVHEAVTLYHRILGFDANTMASKDLCSLPADPAPNQPYAAYYRLFGQRANVFFAQVCRMATSALTTDALRELEKRSNTGPDTQPLSIVDTLIACGLDLFDWYTTFLPWPALVTGLHASAMVGFLLRSVSDDDMVSETRMARIAAVSASRTTEASLSQLLYRFTSAAEAILTPFAPYDPQIATVLESLTRTA